VGTPKAPQPYQRLVVAAAALFLMAACARAGPAADVSGPPTVTSQTATATATPTAAAITTDEQMTVNSPVTSTLANPARPTLGCEEQSWITLSLDANFVGQPSPVEAARWFVVQSWVDGYSHTADAAWAAGPSDESGTFVTTEGAVLHAVQLPNRTWVIDSATRCA
jgi:hypothetical protein